MTECLFQDKRDFCLDERLSGFTRRKVLPKPLQELPRTGRQDVSAVRVLRSPRRGVSSRPKDSTRSGGLLPA
jgi:hypothetical protein